MDNNNNWINPSSVGTKIPSDLSQKTDESNNLLNQLLETAREMNARLDDIRVELKEIQASVKNETVVLPEVATTENVVPDSGEYQVENEEYTSEPLNNETIEYNEELNQPIEVIPNVQEPVQEVSEPLVTETNTNVLPQEPTPVALPNSGIISMDELLGSELNMPEVPNFAEPEQPAPIVNQEIPTVEPVSSPVIPEPVNLEQVQPTTMNQEVPVVEQTIAPIQPAPVIPEQPAPTVSQEVPVEPVVEVQQPVVPETPQVSNNVEVVDDFYATEVISSDSLQRSLSTPAGFNEKIMASKSASVAQEQAQNMSMVYTPGTNNLVA